MLVVAAGITTDDTVEAVTVVADVVVAVIIEVVVVAAVVAVVDEMVVEDEGTLAAGGFAIMVLCFSSLFERLGLVSAAVVGTPGTDTVDTGGAEVDNGTFPAVPPLSLSTSFSMLSHGHTSSKLP